LHPKTTNKKRTRTYISDRSKLATTRILTRILTYLGEVDEDILTHIVENCCCKVDRISEGLHWLICNGIVLKQRGTLRKKMGKGISDYETFFYSINKKFIELRKNLN